MRIGIVCPYALDVAGGVQLHVRDQARELRRLGHEVGVLAPGGERAASAEDGVDEGLELAGRVVAVPFNGSVARLSFGPVTNSRVRRWLATGGWDLVHVHEPASPSLGLLALLAAEVPVVATFHSALDRSRAMRAAQPLLRPGFERLSARIAVSEDARRTVVEHLGGDAVVVPNGVRVADFADAQPDPRWLGARAGRPPVVGFLGRVDEPRKGLAVLAGAVPRLRAQHPGVRVLVAGSGDGEALRALPAEDAAALVPLGPVSEADKRALLASVDVYVAPQIGGESFGIVLVEAMAAGAPVVASALPAFRRVLGQGALGALFPVGDSAALAAAVHDVLGDPASTAARRDAAALAVRRYDWSVVADELVAVYETVLQGDRARARADARTHERADARTHDRADARTHDRADARTHDRADARANDRADDRTDGGGPDATGAADGADPARRPDAGRPWRARRRRGAGPGPSGDRGPAARR
ncbi:glycosyltransferase family 4 protein [uncultured Pseudokineococcus sp.]|uniref:glycosyltransferase family 4 protein n=1 Tax=uncultured Pseudokineococcus sp. TaxID=1642928 RepID=UPI0026098333|nr:glycosyltransferase family 4 protein [uncultured Pseudokineococcus sp.]